MSRHLRSACWLVAISAGFTQACTKAQGEEQIEDQGVGISLSGAVSAFTDGAVQRLKFDGRDGYAIVEVLDDNLVHVEFGAKQAPKVETPIYSSPMVHRTHFAGPTEYVREGNSFRTKNLSVRVQDNGCIQFTDRSRADDYLTTLCPVDVGLEDKGFNMDPRTVENVYGLGQNFAKLGAADGDWTRHGRFTTQGWFGNNFMGFYGGADPQVQFPVMYAVGANRRSFGLFLDNVYKQDWNFQNNWWTIRMRGDQIRFYFMAGQDLPKIRRDYMDLTGRPPVLPRKALGLWVSEFGFDSWREVDSKLKGLRDARYPVDGFVLDLQWFGGATKQSASSPMGGLSWDEKSFPNPGDKIARYADDGIGLMTIEESYVATNQANYRSMLAPQGRPAHEGGMVHVCNSDKMVEFSEWMGNVGMIDWSDSAHAAWWHDNVRFPNIVQKGIVGHWTDLGEPEKYDGNGCYQGVEAGRYGHADVHNIYNLLWHQSIYKGYVRNHRQVSRRPFMMSRAGAPGMQRYGAAMWSGDIASRLDVLATHMNAAMHMSFVGVDYYGSDAGGFWRRAVKEDTNHEPGVQPSEQELYTQWYANSAWFDIPLRPHVYNCGFSWLSEPGVQCPYETSPAAMGNPHSNRENTRQRYELIPYYYSLAYRAHLYGEPVIAPVVMYHQDDPNVRQMGHERLIGRDLIVGVAASHGQGSRRMYLPAGTWVNYHTNEWVHSKGENTQDLPLWRATNGANAFRLPVFARAGAIIPLMFVDENTKNSFGARLDGTERSELVVRVFAAPEESLFTLYEDDGTNVAGYNADGLPSYETRSTEIRQSLSSNQVNVTIEPASGAYKGASAARNNELRVVTEKRSATQVSVNGEAIPAMTSRSAFASCERGWFSDDANTTLIRTGKADVTVRKSVVVTLR